MREQGQPSRVRRLNEEGLRTLALGLGDKETLERYAAKIVYVPGSDCAWWTGAVSGRGHGRFWLAPGRVVIAHRFAFALVNGVDELAEAALLGHRCDNPLCQRVGSGHVEVSSALRNRREWAARRRVADEGPLNDPRGPRRRAVALRDLAREDPRLVAQDLEDLKRRLGEQLRLW